MKKIILLIVLLILPATVHAGEKKSYTKTQKIDFDSTDVDGLVRSPDGAYLSQKKGIKFLPLYKVDKMFDKKIKNSVEYLR
jgi:hypothetical protein